MKETGIAGLMERFADLPDSRVEGRMDHDLRDIVVLALGAVMSGADMEDRGRAGGLVTAVFAPAQPDSRSRCDPPRP